MLRGVPFGTEEYVVGSEMGAVKAGGVDCPVRYLAGVPNRQATLPIATKSLGQKGTYLGHMDTDTSLEPRRRVGNGAQWAFEHIVESPEVFAAQ